MPDLIPYIATFPEGPRPYGFIPADYDGLETTMRLTHDFFRHQLEPDQSDLDLQGDYSICYLADRPLQVKEVLQYSTNGVTIEDIFGRVIRVGFDSLIIAP